MILRPQTHQPDTFSSPSQARKGGNILAVPNDVTGTSDWEDSESFGESQYGEG